MIIYNITMKINVNVTNKYNSILKIILSVFAKYSQCYFFLINYLFISKFEIIVMMKYLFITYTFPKRKTKNLKISYKKY